MFHYRYEENGANQTEEEVRRLMEEKSQLVAKTEELRNLLCDRQCRVEMLESKMKELEDEVKKQRYSLKQKVSRRFYRRFRHYCKMQVYDSRPATPCHFADKIRFSIEPVRMFID